VKSLISSTKMIGINSLSNVPSSDTKYLQLI